MGNLGGGEILVIMLLALLVLGPERLPQVMRKAGQMIGDVKRMSAGFQQEMRNAMEETGLDELAQQASKVMPKSKLVQAAQRLPATSTARPNRTTPTEGVKPVDSGGPAELSAAPAESGSAAPAAGSAAADPATSPVAGNQPAAGEPSAD